MSDSTLGPLYVEFAALLADHRTTFAQIEAAGWKMECNEGGCFWRHQQTQSVVQIPRWAKEWAYRSAVEARETLRKQMRALLGG